MKSKFVNFFHLVTFVIAAGLLSGCGGNSIEDSSLSSKQQMYGAPENIPTFAGPRSNYFIVKNDDKYSIQDKSGSEGTRIIPVGEKIKFSDVTLTLDMEQQVSQISKEDYQLLVELYIAFFNRLPDAEGLSYWIGRVKAGMTINDISNNFYNAGILYSALTGYSTNMSNEEFIQIIYKNVLGRSEVDQGGLTYWSSSLANGSETRGTLIRTILNSAHTFKGDATWGKVADLLDNKFTVANNFANIGGVTFNTPNESITKGMEILALVTSSDITAATKQVNERAAVSHSGKVVAWGKNVSGQTSIPVGLNGVTAIAGGKYDHSVALMSNGTVAAWGWSGYGKTTIPVGLSGVVAITAGGFHTVALKSDGKVIAWGDSRNGKTTIPEGLSSVISIAAGANYTLALKSDGTVVAWGENSYGEATIPTGLSGVVAIAAGYFHSVALKSDGTVVAWGLSSDGRTAIPNDLKGVVAVAAGHGHTVALKSDGTVVAWGYAGYGQTTFPSGLSGVVAIAAGLHHTVALKSDGTVVAWGSNLSGQTTIPLGLKGVTAIAAGSDHTLAIVP